MKTAITRKVADSINNCELTYAQRQKIDVEKAREQHQNFEDSLRKLGAEVLSLESDNSLPDSVFVEDTAVVTRDVAVIASMGAQSRKGEPQKTAQVLKQFRPLKYMNTSVALEGGDVVEVEDSYFVGISTRTSKAGFDHFAEILMPYGYKIIPVPVKGCLHLTTAGTYIGKNTMLANPNWVDISMFKNMDVIEINSNEPWAGNAVHINGQVLLPASSARTAEKLYSRGFEVHTVDVSELEKAEAGLTCMCVIF